jgi:hypothetical protein
MDNPLGPNWKTRLAGILTVLVPPVLYALLTNYAHLSEDDARTASGYVMGILAAAGLAYAKGHDVSHARSPLAEGQTVDAPKDAPKPSSPGTNG